MLETTEGGVEDVAGHLTVVLHGLAEDSVAGKRTLESMDSSRGGRGSVIITMMLLRWRHELLLLLLHHHAGHVEGVVADAGDGWEGGGEVQGGRGGAGVAGSRGRNSGKLLMMRGRLELHLMVELLLDVSNVDSLPHRELVAEAAIRVEDEDGGGGAGGEVVLVLLQRLVTSEVLIPGQHLLTVHWLT